MRIFAVDKSLGVVSRAIITKRGDESEAWYIAGGRLTRRITDCIRRRLSEAWIFSSHVTRMLYHFFLGSPNGSCLVSQGGTNKRDVLA